MRIAHIVHQFPCISEPFVMDQITGMMDRGHDLGIFAEARPSRDPFHPQIEAYRLLQKTRYLPRRAASPRRLLVQAAKAVLGRPHAARSLYRANGRNIRNTVRSLASFHGFVWPHSPRYDIIHGQFGCVARSYWNAKDFWGAKLVVSFRGHDYSSMPRLFGPAMYRELFDRADAILAVCRYAATRLEDLGCPPEKIITHFSGTNVRDFAFRERLPVAGRPIRLLSVARLEESKGLEYALRAVSRLTGEHQIDAHYSIVGGGSLRPQLESLAASLGLGDRVTFHGPQNRSRVSELMDQHDLFVLPSVTTHDGGQEGIPGTVREAMACGMPVISTQHAGIPELVEDGVSGYLVPERDVDRLARRLLELARQPESWSGMGRSGRRRVECDFNIDILNQRLEAIYRHVLAGRIPADFTKDNAVPAAA